MNVLARLVTSRRSVVLVLTVMLAAGAAYFGAGVRQSLVNGGFQDPASESVRVNEALARDFGTGVPNVVVIVSGRAGRTVDDPRVARAAQILTRRIAAFDGVESVSSYWTDGRPAALRSKGGSHALVLVRLSGNDGTYQDTAQRLVPRLHDDQLALQFAGSAQTYVEIERVSAQDLLRAELLIAPITFILLLLVFGSLTAAVLPLAVGAIAVVTNTAILQLLTEVTPVSTFALNVTTALGFGLAIDYSLFMISRFRDELADGAEVGEAVHRTVRTAGLTVVFSALTVALSLSALLLFPMYFLRSIAYGGIAVVLVAGLTSVVALPALLAVLGHRVNRLDVLSRFRRRSASTFWRRLAMTVMRRPILIATAVVGLLLVLGSPFLSATFSLADDRVLPASAPARQAAQVLRDSFEAGQAHPIPVVIPHVHGQDAQERLPAYAARLSTVAGVSRVDTLTGAYVNGRQVAPATAASARFSGPAGSWLSIVSAVEPYSPQGRALVAALRAAGGAPGDVMVGGEAAQLVDTLHAMSRTFPKALGVIALTTFILLFLFTGSVIIPLKAIALNLLSLTATFGAMVFVFQYEHLTWIVGGFAGTGTIDATMPVLTFCIAFGLSMDYEVFLLSRIREEYVRTADNTRSVALGLERTGRVMTASALLIGSVFLTFATSGLTLLKLLGLGLTLAVVIDATLVRGLLVPAFMRLAGRANWWAPEFLRRLHDRFGLSEPASPAIGTGATAEVLRESAASSTSTALSSAQGRARHDA